MLALNCEISTNSKPNTNEQKVGQLTKQKRLKDTITPGKEKKKKKLNNFWDTHKILKTIKFISHYDNSEAVAEKEFRIS